MDRRVCLRLKRMQAALPIHFVIGTAKRPFSDGVQPAAAAIIGLKIARYAFRRQPCGQTSRSGLVNRKQFLYFLLIISSHATDNMTFIMKMQAILWLG